MSAAPQVDDRSDDNDRWGHNTLLGSEPPDVVQSGEQRRLSLVAGILDDEHRGLRVTTVFHQI